MSALNANIGEYRVVDFIGAGGMGEVYRAVHTRLGRLIAIKILNQMEQPFIQRFQNEVRIQASLRHPAIAEYYGLHEFEGRPCLLMELVDGETLADRLRSRGTFPPAEACAILRQVAEAVGYVHSQGIVHRDLKANNIKIDSAGRVKLLDFGIARQTRSSRLTRTGMLIGTLENLAPEQIGGGEGDARSDIWALGILLYEMVTGRLPFRGQSPTDLYARIRAARYTPSPALDHVISACLRKKPAQRFQSAAELIAALDAAALEPEPAAPRPGRKRGWLAVTAATVGPVALVLLSGHSHSHKPVVTASSATAATQTITVDALGGPADVYRDGRRVGTTPYKIRAAMGDKVTLELRRAGSRDLPVSFDVTERSVYSYAMDPQ